MTTPDGVVLLEASGVSKRFAVGRRVIGAARRMVHAVDGVSLCVVRGETLGIVGESGCGKSTLGRCLMRLHDVSEGSVVFDGINITHRSRNALRPIRRRRRRVLDPCAPSAHA